MKKIGNLLVNIISLVVGLFFLVRGLGVVVQDFQTGIDYNTMSEEQVIEGTLVEGEIIYVIDYFEEETLSHRGRSTSITLSRMYFIPIGDKFMAVRVDGTLCDKMDQIVEETWNYLDGYAEQIITTFPMKGKIKALDSQDRRYAYDYLREALSVSTDAECDPYLVPYYIDCRYYGKAYIPLGIAAFCLLMAICEFMEMKKAKGVVYTSNDDKITTYTEDTYQSPIPEEPKEPVMREDPFEVARREQMAATMEMASDSISDEQETDTSESNSGSSLRLKLKDD